jgi:hypothetical protein
VSLRPFMYISEKTSVRSRPWPTAR